MRLAAEERAVVHCIYDHPAGLQPLPVAGPLAAYLILLHIVGVEAKHDNPPPWIDTDIFTLSAAIGPHLCEFLQRSGETLVCPMLNRRWSKRAAA